MRGCGARGPHKCHVWMVNRKLRLAFQLEMQSQGPGKSLSSCAEACSPCVRGQSSRGGRGPVFCTQVLGVDVHVRLEGRQQYLVVCLGYYYFFEMESQL